MRKSKKCIKSGIMSAILSAAMLMTGVPAAAAETDDFSAFSAEEVQAEETDAFSAEDDMQEEADLAEEFSAGVLDEEELTEGIELEEEEILSAEAAADGVVELNEENFPDNDFRTELSSTFDLDHDGKINVSDVKEIKVVDCWIHEMDGIELFTELEVLDCSRNNYIKTLDLSNNKKLRELDCSGNSLTSLDVSNNVNLIKLDCSSNSTFESLDVSMLPNLEILCCTYLELESLDISKNEKLKELICYNNNLSSIDVSSQRDLTKLNCEDNPITSLDISNNEKLTELICRWNKLTSLTMGDNKALEKLYCSFNTSLNNLDLSKCTNLKELDCGVCNLLSLDVSANLNLKELDCGKNRISKLDVSKNPQLSLLDCGDNALTDLDVSMNSNLETLFCYKNNLSSLNVSKNAKLQLLECSENNLSILDVSANPELTCLWCMDDKLTSLDLSSNTKLTEVKCDANQINEIKGGGNAAITSLNKIHNITVSSDSTYDLSKLPGNFEVKYSNSWSGGSVEGNILTVDKKADQVTFNYGVFGEQLYREITGFTLVISRPEGIESAKPAKVTGLKASSDTSSIKLTWNKVSEATGYKVQRYNASKKKYETITTVKGTSCTDKKLSAATGYTYRVYAYATKDGKTVKGAVSSSVKVLTAPSAPGFVKISRSGAKTDKAKAVLTFAPSKRASYYDIYKYNVKTKKYENAFRVKGKTLYSYNAGTKKYTKVNSVKTTSKTITCTLTNLKLKSDGTQKYVVRAAVQKSGYTTKTSAQSKVVTLK